VSSCFVLGQSLRGSDRPSQLYTPRTQVISFYLLAPLTIIATEEQDSNGAQDNAMERKQPEIVISQASSVKKGKIKKFSKIVYSFSKNCMMRFAPGSRPLSSYYFAFLRLFKFLHLNYSAKNNSEVSEIKCNCLIGFKLINQARQFCPFWSDLNYFFKHLKAIRAPYRKNATF
jgi:hypothetical protein